MSTSIGPNGPIEPDQKTYQEIPEPEQWEPWHERAFKAAQELLRSHDRRKLSKELLTREKLSKANRAIRHGFLTRQFLESEFWLECMKPALGEDQSLKPWEPGDKRTLEEVAVDHLFASGKAAFAKIILRKFDDLIRAGDEAKKVVAADVDRQEEINKLGV